MAQVPITPRPPANEAPLRDDGQHTHAWIAYHDGVADRLADLSRRMGIADGSDAPAGQIGEYLTAALASGSPVTLTTGTFTTIVSLSLTAGDWDVDGGGVINCGLLMNAGYIALSATPAAAGSFSPLGLAQISNTSMSSFVAPTGTVRVSLTAPALVYLIGFSDFTTGPATSYGTIRARRVR